MNVLALQCRSCGAPLEFSARATHVRCRYCSSLMLVRRLNNKPTLDVVEQGKAVEAIVTADETMIELKEQLRAMDRIWLSERDGLLRDLNQQAFRMVGRSDFTAIAALAVIGFAACSAAMWFAGANGIIYMALFGVVPVVFLIARGGLNPFDSASYLRQHAAYEEKRSRLVEQIRQQFESKGIDAEEVDLLPGQPVAMMKD